MKLVTNSPFRALHPEINQVLGASRRAAATSGYPPVDVVEEKKAFVIYAEIPGVRSEDVKVRLDDHVLTVSGEKRQEAQSGQQDFCRVERTYGDFQRSFTLPTTVDAEKISARFKYGVLTITLDKLEKATAKDIPIFIN